ncbi:PPE family protein PPE58, partial [Mycobacterium tuberculosis M1456]
QADREQRGRGKHSSNRRPRGTIRAVPGRKYPSNGPLSKLDPICAIEAAPMAGAAADPQERVGPRGRRGLAGQQQCRGRPGPSLRCSHDTPRFQMNQAFHTMVNMLLTCFACQEKPR